MLRYLIDRLSPAVHGLSQLVSWDQIVSSPAQRAGLVSADGDGAAVGKVGHAERAHGHGQVMAHLLGKNTPLQARALVQPLIQYDEWPSLPVAEIHAQ